MKDNQSQKLSFEQWDTMIKEETHWDVSPEEKVFPRKKQSVKKKVNKPEKIKVENNPKENVAAIFDRIFDKELVKIFQSNENFYNKINQNNELKERLRDDLLDFVYEEEGEQV